MFTWFERLVHPYPDAPPPTPPKGFAPFLWACSEGTRGYIAAMTAFTAAIGAFEALLFAMMGRILDWLAAVAPADLWARQKQTLGLLALVLLASIALAALQSLFKQQALAGNFPMRLRWNFHRLMLAQSLGFYQDEFAGRIATKVMQSALAVRDVWMILADIMVYVVIYFVTMAAILGGFDLWTLAPFVLWLALYVVSMRYFVPRLGRVAQQQADARSLMTGRITDAYTNIATVKLFSHSQREAGYARSAMQEFLATVYRQMRLGQRLRDRQPGAVGAVDRQHRGRGAGAMDARRSRRRCRRRRHRDGAAPERHLALGDVGDGQPVRAHRHGAGRHHHAVAAAHGARPPRMRKPLLVTRGELRFEGVGFAYNPKRRVIDDMTLTIRPGEKIGLVGRSGAGKSTVVNLLLRFYDIQQGRILIDGQDIALVTQDSLREQVGMVTQDTSLLHRSVRDNIVYGRPDASDAQMVAAALKAEAHEFVQTLVDPKGRSGYDAHVGERGVKLSGGQRQRIAIARVMLKDAPILLLDEATSALDSEVEVAIQASLYKLMQGKTVVAIAHRLSTIAAMDRLVVMDHGRIVEEGTHASLLASGGIYARLWAHQSGGFLGEEKDEEAVAA